MSRAWALTTWQGQVPYNCPLQHFSDTSLKHLHLVTTLEGELLLCSTPTTALIFVPVIMMNLLMFNFPVSVRKKILPLLEIYLYTWIALHHSPFTANLCCSFPGIRKDGDVLHMKKKQCRAQSWSEELSHQVYSHYVHRTDKFIQLLGNHTFLKTLQWVLLFRIPTTSMLKEQLIFFHTSTSCTSFCFKWL